MCVQYTIFSEEIDPEEEREIKIREKKKDAAIAKAEEKDAAVASGKTEEKDAVIALDMNDMLDNIAEKKKEFYEEAKAIKKEHSAQPEVTEAEAAEVEAEKAARPHKDTQFLSHQSSHPPKDAKFVPSKNGSPPTAEKESAPIPNKKPSEHKP